MSADSLSASSSLAAKDGPIRWFRARRGACDRRDNANRAALGAATLARSCAGQTLETTPTRGCAFLFAAIFLAACVVGALDGQGCQTPEWSTVEILDVTGSISAIDRYPLTSLKALGGLQSKELDCLLASRWAPQLIAIGLKKVLRRDEAGLWDKLLALDKLRVLALDEPIDPPLWQHPLSSRIELVVVCRAYPDDIPGDAGFSVLVSDEYNALFTPVCEDMWPRLG